MKQLAQILRLDATVPMVDQAVVSLAGFLTNIILVRVLGLTDFGAFNLIWLVILFCFGIQQALIIAPLQTIAVHKKEEQKRIFLGHILLFFISLAIFFTILIFAGVSTNIFSNTSILRENKMMLISNLIFFLLNDYLRKLFFVENNLLTVLLLDIISYGTQLLLLFGFNYFGNITVSTALTIVLLSNILSASFGLFHHPSISIKFNTIIENAKECWQQSRWLLGTCILQWSAGNYFILAATAMLSITALGAIKMVQTIMGCLNVLFLALENYIPAKASLIYHEQGFDSMCLYLKKATTNAAVVVLPILGILFFFSTSILSLICGKEFIHYGFLIKEFVCLYILVFLGTQLRFAVRASNANNIIFYAYIASTLFSLSTASYIISIYKESGVVMGLIATQLITIIFLLLSLKTKTTKQWKLFI